MSTPIYLGPLSIGTSTEDLQLRRFLQQYVAGVSGLDPTLVRPRWQPEPPAQPPNDVTWCGVGETHRTRDTFAFEGHTENPDNWDQGQSFVIRQSILNILTSFYGPEAQAASEQFAMGVQLALNRSWLTLNNYGLVDVDEGLTVPEKVNERWIYRIDVKFRLRRTQKYTYRVLCLIGADVIINYDDPIMSQTIRLTPNYGGAGFNDAPFGS